MPGAAVSAACGLPSPRTDLEMDVGASPHAKPSGTKRPAALVTPLLASMFTVASRFRRLNFVGSDLSTIEAVGTGSWLSVVQVLLDVSIALLVAIIEFHGGIQRGYRTISSEFFFVKRYMQDHLDRVSSWRKNLRLHWDPPKFFFQVEKSTTPIKKSFGG